MRLLSKAKVIEASAKLDKMSRDELLALMGGAEYACLHCAYSGNRDHPYKTQCQRCGEISNDSACKTETDSCCPHCKEDAYFCVCPKCGIGDDNGCGFGYTNTFSDRGLYVFLDIALSKMRRHYSIY